MIASLLLLIAISAAPVAEPNTGAQFENRMEFGGKALSLTGVDRRRALGQDAYAVAHYFAGPAEARELAATERLQYYTDTPAHKALIFQGVYKSVPAYAIRRSWNKHFKELGVPPREDFVAAFQESFDRGQRLYFIASPEGRLEIRQDDRLLGVWDDPALVRTLWAMCLGPTAEIVERQNLVALDSAPEITAGRDSASDGPDKESLSQ